MNKIEDFKFKRGDLVHVVNFGKQYSMHYKVMGEFLSEAYDEPFIAHSIAIGDSLKHRGHKEGEESFKVISCGHSFPCYGNTKVYLLASEEELKRYKDRSCEEKDYYPFPVYVVDEEGLEEVKQKVFLVEFLPNTAKADVRIVDFWSSFEAYINTGNKVETGEVKEDFFNNNPKAHRLLVAVSALDRDEAQEKGTELFKEYLVGKVNRLSEERTEAEWMLGRLDEKLEDEEEQS